MAKFILPVSLGANGQVRLAAEADLAADPGGERAVLVGADGSGSRARRSLRQPSADAVDDTDDRHRNSTICVRSTRAQSPLLRVAPAHCTSSGHGRGDGQDPEEQTD